LREGEFYHITVLPRRRKKTVFNGFFLYIKKGSPEKGSLTVYQSQLQEF